MKKILFFILISPIFFSQKKNQNTVIYDKYPYEQKDYIGGNVKFYKDVHEIIAKKKITPCEDKNEIFIAKIIIFPDRTIKLIKDMNPENVQKNKCAYELTKVILGELKDWNPVQLNGEKVAAITTKVMFPESLFENYKEDYDAHDYYGPRAEFPGGMEAFRKKFLRRVNVNGFTWNHSGQLYLQFKVDENGKTTDFRINPTSGNKDFDKRLIEAAKSIKDTWKPSTIHGFAIESDQTLPITLSKD